MAGSTRVDLGSALEFGLASDSNGRAADVISLSGLAWNGAGDQAGGVDAALAPADELVRSGFCARAARGSSPRPAKPRIPAGMHMPHRMMRLESLLLEPRERSAIASLMDLRAVVWRFLRNGNVMWMVLPNRRRRYLDESCYGPELRDGFGAAIAHSSP